MKFLHVPLLLVIALNLLAPTIGGPTGVVTRAVKPSSAARLHEIVTRLQEFVASITDELKSFETELKKQSAEQEGTGEPHGMVVVDEETEKPATSTAATEVEEGEEKEPEDECHCDCDEIGRAGTRKRRGGSKINGQHVAEILKTIRELLHEADGRR